MLKNGFYLMPISIIRIIFVVILGFVWPVLTVHAQGAEKLPRIGFLRFIDSALVDASSISVETLNGTVMLAGFAKSTSERANAESIASLVNGVKLVKNEIAVRP